MFPIFPLLNPPPWLNHHCSKNGLPQMLSWNCLLIPQPQLPPSLAPCPRLTKPPTVVSPSLSISNAWTDSSRSPDCFILWDFWTYRRTDRRRDAGNTTSFFSTILNFFGLLKYDHVSSRITCTSSNNAITTFICHTVRTQLEWNFQTGSTLMCNTY